MHSRIGNRHSSRTVHIYLGIRADGTRNIKHELSKVPLDDFKI
jgi:hypothetical protein